MFFHFRNNAKSKASDSKHSTTPSNNQIKFAEYVISVYGGGMSSPPLNSHVYEEECNRLITQEKCSGRLDTSERIFLLSVAGDRLTMDTPYEAHLKIQCYLFAGSLCRKKAIECISSYITSGEIWVEPNADPKVCKELLVLNLAKCYEDEKMYHQALEQYEWLHNYDKTSEQYAVCIVRTLNKLYMFDLSLQFLEEMRNTKLYKMSGRQYQCFYEAKENARLLDEYKRQGLYEREIDLLARDPSVKINAQNFFRLEIDWAAIATGAAIASKRDRDDYAWISENLPNLCPKSFSGYMRMKNQRTKNFIVLANSCLDFGRNITIEDEYSEQKELWNEITKTNNPLYFR